MRLTSLTIPARLVFDRRPGHREARDDFVQIQLEGVCARLLDDATELQPRLRCRPVEGSDDRDVDCALEAADVLRVCVGAERVVVGVREVGELLGKLAGPTDPCAGCEPSAAAVICSSNSECRTTAAQPASSSRFTESRRCPIGDAPR